MQLETIEFAFFTITVLAIYGLGEWAVWVAYGDTPMSNNDDRRHLKGRTDDRV